jgi:hypothetical protein
MQNTLIITDAAQLEETLAITRRLNKRKYYLARRDDQTAAQWLDLADEYSKLSSLANAAFCRCEAMRLGHDPDQEVEPVEDDLEPEPVEDNAGLEVDIPVDEVFDWELRADIGDD